MEDKKQPDFDVKSVFKNGRMPTREEYTNLWIYIPKCNGENYGFAFARSI